MSYLDPQRWGDIDAGGNAMDWGTRKGKLLYPGYEMLRLALVERCEVTSTAVPGILQTARAPGRIYTGDWFSNFHDTISTLIPKFVNHADNEGNWDGRATIGPVWNEADILVEIGDVSRIPAPDIPLAEWSIQQYKILNELLWVKLTIAQYESSELKTSAATGPHFSWAAAVTAFLADAWSVSGADQNSGIGTLTLGEYGAQRSRVKAKAGSYSIPIVVDWYLFTADWPVQPPLNEFDDEGMGFIADRYWLYEADTEYGIGVTLLSDFPTNREDAPPAPTNVQPRSSRKGWLAEWGNASQFYAIVKFDVFGGFKFVDK